MSKHDSTNAIAVLRKRVEQAQHENRWKDALDLARTLVWSADTEENRSLLRGAALGFARSLADRNRTRDLVSELSRLSALFPGDTAWAVQLSQLAVGAGLVAEGLKLLPAGDTEAESRLQGILADGAVQRGPAGGVGLSPEMQADHLRILKAFGFAEKGHDEQARAELQGVGMRSPFAEWRLFLRGLLAYHAQDDVQAIQAWARLAPGRVPFRLAAPLRQEIDSTFREAQTPETRLALTRQAKKLDTTNPLANALGRLQKSILQQEGTLASEFTALQTLKPQLDALDPKVRDRLSRSIYWSLMQAPEDVKRRYLKTFPPPAEDPRLHRLRAINLEHERAWAEAADVWLSYEKDIATNRKLWGDDTERVRALIWLHVGHLASVSTLTDDEDEAFPDFYQSGSLSSPKKKEPVATAEACFQRAREFGPDLIQAYIAPIKLLCSQEKFEEARPLADELRRRFPEHVTAQVSAASVYRDLGDVPSALACLEQAVRINPLDKEIRAKRSYYASSLVMSYLHAGNLALATETLAQARAWNESPEHQAVLGVMEATIAWKSGDPGPIEKIRQELEKRLPMAAVVYTLVVQAHAANLDRKIRAPFDKEFKDRLDGKMPLSDALTLGHLIVRQGELGGSLYRGFKTHKTKIIKKLGEAAEGQTLSPGLYLDLAILYFDLDASRPLRQMITAMPLQYPQVVRYYLQYLDDARLARRGSRFYNGPPVYYLRFVEQLLPSVKDEDLRTLLQQRLDLHKQQWGVDNFSSPFDHTFGGFDDEEEGR